MNNGWKNTILKLQLLLSMYLPQPFSQRKPFHLDRLQNPVINHSSNHNHKYHNQKDHHLLLLITLLSSVKSAKELDIASRCIYRYSASRNNGQQNQSKQQAHTSTQHPNTSHQANTSIQINSSHISEHPICPAAPLWIPDSAATSHMTYDSSLLVDSYPYTGTKTVMVGNWYHIPITLVVTSILHTSTGSFTLSNVLFVPQLTQNLIFVGVFTRERNCSIGFTPWGYEITDLTTHRTLDEGIINNNLYPIHSTTSSPNVPSTHVSITASPPT